MSNELTLHMTEHGQEEFDHWIPRNLLTEDIVIDIHDDYVDQQWKYLTLLPLRVATPLPYLQELVARVHFRRGIYCVSKFPLYKGWLSYHWPRENWSAKSLFPYLYTDMLTGPVQLGEQFILQRSSSYYSSV